MLGIVVFLFLALVLNGVFNNSYEKMKRRERKENKDK